MSAGGMLRLLHCRPQSSVFDDMLRSTLVPDLCAKPGVEKVWAARQGPDDTGPRVVVSVWASRDAMRSALGDGDGLRSHPEDHPGLGEPGLEAHPIVREVVDPAPFRDGILRIARGVLGEIEVESYAEHVLEGVHEDLRHGHGPQALVLAKVGERSFVTVSAWADWARIQVATGATVRDPIRTRRPTELASFDAQHYEVIALSP